MKSTKFAHFLVAAALTLSVGSSPIVSADDTELYLGDLGGNVVRHNVLFVLDTSLSMRSNIAATGKSRIDTLREAMDSLIAGLDNVNVGIMRMNGTKDPEANSANLFCDADLIAAGGQKYGRTTGSPTWGHVCYMPTGGTVLFPVANLDAPLTDFGSEFSSEISSSIITSEDDATQTVAAANATTDAQVLEVAYQQCGTAPGDQVTIEVSIDADNEDDSEDTSDGDVFDNATIELANHPAGFIFEFDQTNGGVTIPALPAQAPIISANIEFTAQSAGDVDVNTSIYGELNPVPNDFGDGANNITSRARTSAIVSWPSVPAVVAEDTFTTPDISSIVQEIVDQPGWDTNGSNGGSTGQRDIMAILFEGDDGGISREVYARDSGSVKAAKLSVTYCANPVATKQRVGLRFQDMRIPQGATITGATIDFTAANPNLNQDGTAGTDNVIIYAEDTDNANDFSLSNPTINARSPTTASIDWTVDQMGTWVEGNSYSTPDLSAAVQEVTDRGGWCGGNSLAMILEGDTTNVMRAAQSFDAGAPPVLRVSYDETGISGSDTGCNVRTHSVPVAQSDHDARMETGGSDVVRIDLNGLPMGNSNEWMIGTIFKAPISPGSNVISARLVFTATGNANASGLSPLIVNAEASDDADAFTSSAGDLSAANRPRVTGTGIPVTLDVPAAASNTPFPVDGGELGFDVKPLVDQVIARPGWDYDNKIAFFVTNGATNIYRQAHARDANNGREARLVLEVQEDSASSTVKTVRERLFEINDTLKTSNLLGWTPSTETLLEAAYYWRSKPVRFGAQRGLARIPNAAAGTIGTANGIDYTQWTERTLTSHPDSHTGGTYTPAGCEFEYSSACQQDLLTNATYVSPFRTGLECSQNFMIFLTDGAPTFVNDVTEAEVVAEFPDISSCSTASSYNSKGAKGRCAREIIEELATKDQDPTLSGDQTVKTHTIAFNLTDNSAVTWLGQLATGGGGNFYTADTADSLIGVFDEIFAEILSVPRSFAAPSISANAFNRLFSRDEAYFGLFLPESDNRWSGNVKKYKLCVDTTLGGAGTCELGDILDANNASAITGDPAQFDSNAQSLWSAAPDGLRVEEGGAGGEITDFNQRTIFTDVALTAGTASLGTELSDTGFQIDASLWDATETEPTRNAVCPTPSTDTSTADGQDCENRMLWMLGKDVLDQDTDGSTTDTRWWFHDVLHSSPVTATYGKAGSDFIDKILVGTNEGGLHMINSVSGVEEWAFIPNSLMGDQIALFDDTGLHSYGMDSTPVLRVNDVNGNGEIDPGAGDFIHVFSAQRRGGSDIYALDITPSSTLTAVTDTIVPKFLWRIAGGVTGDFERMGLSFSVPTLATIGVPGGGGTTVPREVLIFGGGYDPALDSDTGTGEARLFGTAAGDPNLGNAIYVVDAATGARILWMSSSADSSNGDAIEVADMKYSIPSEIKVFDSDGDGYDDRFYVGDTAGQVWRVDLAGIDPSSTATKGNTVVGKLASISTAGGTPPVDERRFFYPPSVVQVLDTEYSNATNGEYDYILLGTGNRANPIDTGVKDRFYAFRDTNIGPMADAGGDNIADDYPRAILVANSNSGAIDHSDLVDVTNDFFGAVDGDVGYETALGWYLDLSVTGVADPTDPSAPPASDGLSSGQAGEKVLSAADVNNGILIFTTYVPADPDPLKPCEPVEGNGFAYNMDILTTKAAIDWDDSTTGYNGISGRSQKIGVGIPSGAIAVFTNEGVTVLIGTGDAAKNLGKIADTPRFNTYWNQK